MDVRNMRPFLILFSLITVSGSASGEDSLFRIPPAARREGDGVIISFELKRKIDVQVSVLGKDGAVVRHLAAGVLGGDVPPPPPLRPGLAQRLAWDGRDDTGAEANGAPFRFRVAAETRVRLGGIIGDPAALHGKIYGLATDDDGNVYVASGGVYDATPVFSIKVFDARGRYLRTILPMPADLSAKSARDFGATRTADGHLQPKNHDPLVPYIHDGGIVAFIGKRIRNGELWLLNTHGKICRLAARDGAPIAWNSAPRTMMPSGGPMTWAVAPDGGTLYMAGWWDWRQKTQSRGDGVVRRVDPATGEATALFYVEVPADSAWLTEVNGWYLFKNWGRKNGQAALHGLAVDDDGRIHVCDRVNRRLAVHDARGRLLGATAIDWPDHVALGKGAVYVVTREVVDGYKALNRFRVVKLDAAINGRVLAALDLPGRNAPQMAVSVGSNPPVVWLSNVGREGDKLVRIEDRGGELVVVGEKVLLSRAGIVKLWADPLTDNVYVNNGWNRLTRYDGLTGSEQTLPISAIDLAVGPDRRLYIMGQNGWKEPVHRLTLDFKPAPFRGTGGPTAGKEIYGRYGCGWSNKGIAVGHDGRIFVRHMYDWCKYHVIAFRPDGTLERGNRVEGGIIGPVDDQSGGICVDRQGNFYVGMTGHPDGSPAGRAYEGCVLKVGPRGGGLVPREGAAAGIRFGERVFEGAVAAYPKLAPRQSRGCVCKEARFDVDDFGRVYVPNVLDARVRIYDNAGNVLLRFGHYGNADSTGPTGRVPVPAIPLGWPMSLGINRAGRLYIADVLNHRIVRVDLSFAEDVVISLR